MSRLVLIAAGISAAIVVFVAGVVLRLPGGYVHLSPNVSVCRSDDEIDSDTRGALRASAERFINTLLGPTPEAASNSVAAVSRGNFNPETIRQTSASLRDDTATGAIVPARVFLLSGIGGGRAGSLLPCGDRSGAEDFVMRNDDSVEQGHVILSQPTTSGARAFEVWMAKENGSWKTIGFHVGPTQILTFSGADLWRQAQEQRARAHSFNAFILYNAARGLLDRGPYVQLGDAAAFRQDFASFTAPNGLNTSFPLEWQLGGRTFLIASMGYIGFTGSHQIALVITWTPRSLSDNDEAERDNHELIDAFIAKYPEWRESFDAVAARALTPDGHSGWGTVYLKDAGYEVASAQPSSAPTH